MHNLNWDNLRYVLTVAESGSVAAASRKLKVNRTTVLRRINSFEQQLNCQLFERGPSGYVMSAEAEQLLFAARELENTIDDVARQIAGREMRLQGELRITTTDALFVSTVGPEVAAFQRKHPHITVELAISNHVLNLTKRDADVAVRPTPTLPPNLVGEWVKDIRFGIYAASSYLDACSEKSLRQHRWLGVDDPLIETPAGRWLRNEIPGHCFCLKANSFLALKVAAEGGLGLALLPVSLAHTSNILQPVNEPIADLKTGLWILTHPDLARSARVNAFMQHFCAALKSDGAH